MYSYQCILYITTLFFKLENTLENHLHPVRDYVLLHVCRVMPAHMQNQSWLGTSSDWFRVWYMQGG